ncbi:ClbS/DfsB family four-helix bundle protein [Citrobacter farmeri]|uniref:ClbS/DfsB family four-helix bundle protein n=1 Tax=Citrobacter farmeri TaxID=67824 RepID=UPI00189C0305|nr:ClbS/DfsB family four-helix bundle protein [Citrobacter farmeri]EKU0079707.1 ClbS/DfsB family four-helix bundle protein [Citrobacter farmeri]MBJ9134660.1 ClbS/DfsB family four-helix bundle protein [Citrobacter farmeri]MDB2170190.1 ClbS/DfsB family four-helix bundle protein [Citrobacter farmeri]MDZ7529187.1 ClbS/DfsB family four-helix bundle protein [Citrobacter farmeri]HCD1998859.1 ClbS/DfsB family four-helix bundle protein [Citrobacter farmeri]
MSVPQTKAELLLAIDKNFSKLIHYLNSIPSEMTSDDSMEGHAKGTEMSVRDLVSYLLGWNSLVVKWITFDAKGQSVDFPETGYKWNQLGLLAQKFYQDYSALSYDSLIAELQTVKNEIVQLINERTDDVLYGKPWYTKWTMGRMISFNTSSPYANANGRLRKWAKNKNICLK